MKRDVITNPLIKVEKSAGIIRISVIIRHIYDLELVIKVKSDVRGILGHSVT